MPRTLGRLSFPLGLIVALLCLASTPVTADVADAPPDPLAGTPIRSVFLRAPQRVTPTTAPYQVLVVLHGMGGNGPDFSRELFDQADKNGWLIVAPTIAYGDWTNPSVVANEDPLLIQALNDYLDTLPRVVEAPVRKLVLLLGHSRGAQLAHRFAEFRPDRVLAVAALSAGTYTLPATVGPNGNLIFPFGVQDMDHYAGHAFDPQRFDNVAFWVGVGGQDTNPGDVPRQWDSVEGSTRVQRARAFESAVRQLGANATLHVFGEAHHELTGEMRSAACDFLQGAVAAQSPRGDQATVDSALTE
ncbi:MAG TPA: alpha/beta fold hydrolase [Chloroflexota bacterium]|jgi:pimeloyl-ACP methyl ester carboxylesterase